MEAATTTTNINSDPLMMASVHGNLMRNIKQQDPFHAYEVLAELGKGSMGAVCQVRKKEQAKGGSARPINVRQHRTSSPLPLCCFPFLGWVVAHYKPISSTTKQDAFASNRSEESMLTEDTVLTLETGDSDAARGSTAVPETDNADTNKPEPSLRHSSSTSSMITYGTRKDVVYALKSIILDRCSRQEFVEELRNEVEILKQLDHPNIVRAMETYEYKKQLYIVLELCSGGDLYTRDPYTEDQVYKIMTSLLKAVAYLHSKGIVHRDLKFENIMFVNNTASSTVRIIDFGLSQKFAANQHLHATVGTAYTMAPELIQGQYGPKVDVWSLGVIAFMLFSSSLPFYGRDKLFVMKKILRGHFSFSAKRWKYVSESAKGFVFKLLNTDPAARPSAEGALKLPWISLPRKESGINDRMEDIQASIKAYSSYGTLKKLALLVVAHKSTSEEIGFLRKMFGAFDTSNDGEISFDEFREAMSENYDYTEDELRELYRGINIGGTGTVHYMEFLAATMEAHGSIDEERLAEAFDRIDSDDSGCITVRDLGEFLGNSDISDAHLERILSEADVDNDKVITYQEFLSLWNDGSVWNDARASVGSKRLDLSIDSQELLEKLEDGTDYFELHKEMSFRNEKVLDPSSRQEL